MMRILGLRRLGLLLSWAGIAAGCGDQSPAAAEAGAVGELSLTIVSGNEQTGLAGEPLPEPVVVKVTDESGAPVARQLVNFRVTGGGGSVFAGAALTNGSGLAQEWWTLGPSVGTNTLEARAVDGGTGERLVFGTFTAEGVDELPSEPAPSSSVIFEEDFESGTLSRWDDNGASDLHRVVNDPALAHSGSHVLEWTYPEGSNGSGWLAKILSPGYDSLMVSYWVKFPSNWRSGTYLLGINAAPEDDPWAAMGKAGVCPNGTDFANATLFVDYSGDPGPLTFYTYHPAMTTAGCYGDTGGGRATYTSARSVSRDEWHRIDFWVRLNTPGEHDGLQRVWVDGVLAGEWGGLRFRDTADLRLNSVLLTAQQSVGVPQTQTLYVDDVVVRTDVSVPEGGTSNPPPQEPVASVEVSPASAELTVGGSVQLRAVAKDAQGNTLTGRSVSWASDNGAVATVDSSGEVTAVGSGSATITATSEGRSGTASIRVSASTPPADAIASHYFEDGTLGPYFNPWGDDAVQVVDDPTGGRGGRVARISYRGSGEDINRALALQASNESEAPWLTFGEEIWFRGYFYLPTPAQGVNENRKILDFSGLGPARSVFHVWGTDLRYTGYRGGEIPGYGNLGTGVRVAMDAWHLIEVRHVMNSAAGASDGIVEFWLDGMKVWSASNLNWLDVGDRFNYFAVGTQVNYSGPKDEVRYWDDVAFSTRRIGP